jgi:hypothetical protein
VATQRQLPAHKAAAAAAAMMSSQGTSQAKNQAAGSTSGWRRSEPAQVVEKIAMQARPREKREKRMRKRRRLHLLWRKLVVS